MSRSSGFFLVLIAALGVCTVLYLLLSESMGPDGEETTAAAAGGAGTAGAGLGAAGLEAGGVRPKTAEEIEAEEAARAEKGSQVLREEGVFGTVTDGAGRPIAGARVLLLADPLETRVLQGVPDGAPLASAVSGEDGSFVVGPAPEDGFAKVRAEANGYAPTVQRVRQRGARVDLILDLGGRLEVRTIDKAGAAVPGAQVIHTAGLVVTSVLTDAGGHAVFPDLPTGTGQLVVVKEGFGTARDTNLAVAPGATEERTLILTPGLEIQGVVTHGETERPVAGVRVSVRYPQLSMLKEGEPVLTDEEGRFTLTAWVGGADQALVRAWKEEFTEGRAWRNGQQKGDVALKIFPAGEALSGQVLTADRQPAVGARVTYTGMQGEGRDEIPETTADEDGAFTLSLPTWGGPGARFTVVALSAGDGMGVAYARIPAKASEPSQPLEITLAGTGTLTGIVKDKGGSAVQGAVVSLTPDWAAMQKRASGGQQVPWQMLNTLSSGEFHNLTGLSGIDGRYEIRDVPALDYKVEASFGLDTFTLPEAVHIVGGERAEADIALGEGGTIEGRILDSEDKPVAGAYVTATPMRKDQGGGWWQGRPTARSQSDGRFILRGIADERHDVTAYAAGYGNATENNISRGQKNVTIRLKARGWIVGVVLREGSPYSGTFTVTARPVQKGGAVGPMGFNAMWSPGQQIRTFNTDDGAFTIKGCNAGDYTLVATTSEGLLAIQPDVVTVVDGRPSRQARLELTEGAVVTGLVKNDDNGEPIPNAWVYAAGTAPAGGGPPPPQGHGQTDRHGRYEIKGLGMGAYIISAYVGGTPVQAPVELQFGERREINLTKLAPGSIEIVVVDEAGAPVEGARSQIRTATGTWVQPNWEAMRKDGLLGENFDWNSALNTNAEGTIRRHHVPPGILTVSVTKQGFAPDDATRQVEVASGRVTRVEITLKRAQ